MIITISGKPGSGKSTIAKVVAKRLNFKHYSTGEHMREMAKKRGISLMELAKLAEKDHSIDKELDDWQMSLGKKEDNFVIDARLGFYFIPKSIKIFLDIGTDEAARRVFKQQRKEESYNRSFKETKENLVRRINSESLRYKKYYGVDYLDLKNYGLIIDTTKLTVAEKVEMIIKYIKMKICQEPPGS